MRSRKSLLTAVAAASGLLGCGYSLLHAFALPLTAQLPPVTFSGTLEQAGVPLGGTHDIAFELWRDPDTSVAANRTCQIPAQTIDVAAGLFELPLDTTCATALRTRNQVWYRLTVDGTVFPLVQVGAAPVALRSARDEQDGTRLLARRRYQTSADGARIPIGDVRPFDSQRNEECAPTPTTESGVARTRCLPSSVFNSPPPQAPPFLDAACTQAPSGRYFSLGGPPSPLPSYLIDPFNADTRLYPLLGTQIVPVYIQSGPGRCDGPLAVSELLIGPQIPLGDFVEMQEVVE